MAKKKAKFDTSQITNFLIAKGEKLGLGVAGGLAVLLLLSALWTVVSTRSAHGELQQAAQGLQTRLNTADPVEGDILIKNIGSSRGYAVVEPGPLARWRPVFDPGAVGENKVSNPPVLPVAGVGKEKTFQMDLVRAPVFVHKLDENGRSIKVLGTAKTAGGPGGSPFAPPVAAPGMAGAGGPGAAPTLARYIDPTRMVVVTTTFPYKDQLDLFRKALRKDTLAQLLADPTAMPQFLGLNVKRCELQDDGKFSDWVDVYFPDPKTGKALARGDINDLLARAPLDMENILRLGHYMYLGLVTPLPQLATGAYPEIKLPDIEPLKINVVGGMNPGDPAAGVPAAGDGGAAFPGVAPGFPGASGPMGQGAPAAATSTVISLPINKLVKAQPTLAEKLEGHLDPFHPLALLPPSKSKKQTGYPQAGYPGSPGAGPGMAADMSGAGTGAMTNFPFMRSNLPVGAGGPGMAAGPGAIPGSPPGPDMVNPMDMGMGDTGIPGAAPPVPDKILVRFLDVDVEPGKTYFYTIQVRVANPNFGKADQVVFRALADIKELPAPWVTTPPISVPPEMKYYVVDQEKIDPTASRRLNVMDNRKPKDDLVAVQFHRWVEQFVKAHHRDEKDCGDWVVAERLQFRRGEVMGRSEAPVLMPEWDVAKNRFELDLPKHPYKNSNGKISSEKFTMIDLLPKTPGPMVVDFKGNERYDDSRKDQLTAVELLVLTADGKLVAHNSREDTETAPNSRGKERFDRQQDWIHRCEDVLRQTQPPAQPGGGSQQPGGGGLPGFGGA